MRRILLLITDLEIGGTPTVVRELALRLRSPDVTIEVACLKQWGPVATQLRDAGVTVTAFDAVRSTQLPGTMRRLRNIVRDQRIDTVISFLVHANTVAAIASRRMPEVRWFQSIHTTQPDPKWHWWVQGWVQGYAEKIIVPSQSVADALHTRSGVPAQKIVVIPNGLDLSQFVPENAQSSGTTFRVGFLGRLDPVKRLPDLIDAMMQLEDQFRLDIFGSGEQCDSIEQLIERGGLQTRVTLRGTTSSPAEALSQMDVLVLPSLAEGFPLVLIEAMAMGIPIVATDAPGIRDAVRDGETGILVPIGSPRKLAESLRLLAADPTLRQRLARNGRAHVESNFTWKKVLPAYRQLLAL